MKKQHELIKKLKAQITELEASRADAGAPQLLSSAQPLLWLPAEADLA